MTTRKDINISNGKVVDLECKRVLYISTTGKYQGVTFDKTYQILFGEAEKQGLFSEDIEVLALYYDNPNQMSIDLCITVSKLAQPSGDIKMKEIDGGKYAMFTYTGPYTDLCHAYEKIHSELLIKIGVEPRSKSNCFIEKYVSNPQVAPEEVKTEIYIPII